MDELGVLIAGGMSGNAVSLEPLLLASLREIAVEAYAIPPDGPHLEAQTVDRAGLVQDVAALATAPMCATGAQTQAIFSGVVPYRSGAVGVRITSDGEILHESPLPAPNGVIAVPSGWYERGEPVNDVLDVSWRSSLDPALDRYLVSYSWDDGDSWTAVSLMLPTRECPIDFTALPGGEQCRLRILGGDGSAAAIFISERFAVRRKGVVCSILMPPNGAVIPAGPTLAVGQAYDYEARRFVSAGLAWVHETAGAEHPPAAGNGAYAMLDCARGMHRLKLFDEGSGSSAEVVFEAVSPDSVAQSPVVVPETPQDVG